MMELKTTSLHTMSMSVFVRVGKSHVLLLFVFVSYAIFVAVSLMTVSVD